MYADFLGFLLTQKELMTKDPNATFDPSVALDLCHVTVAPPTIKTVRGVIEEYHWFIRIAEKAGATWVLRERDFERPGLKLVGGLQSPPDDATYEDLGLMRGAGIIFMTLAYQGLSRFGGGFAEPDEHLTCRGEDLLEAMSAVGMSLDLAHVGETTARDALDYIEARSLPLRVVATHTGCQAVYHYDRNLPDDILERVAALDGLVGIATLTFALHESDNTLGPFRRHLDHAIEICGEDHVAIGTDGIYKTIDLREQEAIFAMMKAKIDPGNILRARFPDQPVELNSASRMAIIKDVLFDAGIHPATVEKLCGDNLFAFLRSVLS